MGTKTTPCEGLRRLWLNPGPDSGWSWVVVVSSLFYSFVLQGIFKAQGYLFVATVETYGVTREEAAWPYVIFFATAHVSGVFAGLLSHYLTCRTIMFISSSLMCIGYAVCFLAPPSVTWLTVGYGIIAGPNVGITFASLLQIVNEYFEKYRTTANQFLMAGLGFGGLIYPFFLYHLLFNYGLRGTFLMLCAFNMHTFVAAALLRPRTPAFFPSLSPTKIVSKNEELQTVDKEVSKVEVSSVVDKPLATKAVTRNEELQTADKDIAKVEVPSAVDKPDETNFSSGVTNPPKDSAQNTNALEKLSYTDLLRSLFRDPMFYIITLSSLFDIVAWGIFFMTVVDYAIDSGISPGLATMLLPVHSAAELVVRLGTGWITDNGYVGIKVFHLASVVLTGVFFALFPLAHGEGLFFTFACILGCLYGTSTGSRLVLYVEYLDVNKMPTANGTLLFLAGVAFLGIPKLLGLLRDSLGSYDLIYFAQGAFCLVSALAWALEPGLFTIPCKSKTHKEEPDHVVSKL